MSRTLAAPEIRFNPATEEWVIIAARRAARPHDTAKDHKSRRALPAFDKNCPFCPGNEHLTPPPIFERPGSEAGTWRLRVVPNKYPALSSIQEPRRSERTGLFLSVPPLGRHEVLVETPLHNEATADRDEQEVVEILEVYQQRYRELAALDGIEYVLVFKNQGEEAGTSLVHPHSQIIAAPVVPERQQRMEAISSEHHRKTRRCLYCYMVDEELRDARRIVHRDDHYVVFHPFAAAHPAETWIVPLEHQASFAAVGRDALSRLGPVLLRTLRQLRIAFEDPDFNYAFRSGRTGAGHYHWHIPLIPRLAKTAGFELASGMYINPMSPEETAERMRSALAP